MASLARVFHGTDMDKSVIPEGLQHVVGVVTAEMRAVTLVPVAWITCNSPNVPGTRIWL